MTDEPRLKIAITATFTAEPLEQPLAFWTEQLNIWSKIEFAPYNQAFQQLLDPSSLLATNQTGINLILIRFEDWQGTGAGAPDACQTIERNAQDFLRALTAAVERLPISYVVCLCPPSPLEAFDPERASFFQRIEESFASELAQIHGVYVITSVELAAGYPVTEYYDAHAEKLAHIPFTQTFFTALGTAIARKIYALKNAPYKVIVLDCDQTLWGGICGEDGPTGIQIDPVRKALQQFMIEQQNGGSLLCLCSKNNEEDVAAVFELRSDMVLKREHIIASRLNWKLKSENIRSLAEELQLGLDSFIFIDDDPVECRDVQTNCPDVLTLQLPRESDTIPRFLRHVWAFDRLKITEEDRKRTALYEQNKDRESFQNESLSFKDFLAGLMLEIQVSPLSTNQLARVLELTQRTNQFNLTNIRRSEAELQRLCKLGRAECLVVHVGDRFGDYGLVGVIIFQADSEAITVDTFLLSCRAMGRGVEHRMLAKLGEIAKERRVAWIEVVYNPTKKNQPVLDFLQSIGRQYAQPAGMDFLFRIPAGVAVTLDYNPNGSMPTEWRDTSASDDRSNVILSTKIAAPQTQAKSALLCRIAKELYDVTQVMNTMATHQLRRSRPDLQNPFVAPRTSAEKHLADIWGEVLEIGSVGVYDNFFELGGHSLAVTQVISRIRGIFRPALSISQFFQEPTVAGLALTLTAPPRLRQEDTLGLTQFISELDQISDAEAQTLLQEEFRSIEQSHLVSVDYGSESRRSLIAEDMAGYTQAYSSSLHSDYVQPICRDFELGLDRFPPITLKTSRAGEGNLLVSEQEPLDRYSHPLDAHPCSKITTVGLVTYRRVEALERALVSYIGNSKKFGRAPDFVVMDGSPAVETRNSYRQMLLSLRARYGTPIFYAGQEEKTRFAEQLIKRGGVPPEVIDFALFDPERCGVGAGANRNALLLHTTGEMLFSADDDTVARTATASQREEGLRLTSSRDPAEFWFFPDRETALRSVTCTDADILASHEQLLGRDMGDILGTLGSTMTPDVTGVTPALLDRLTSSKSRVLMTFNGILGDCGWGSPFGYWGAPIGYLLLDANSRKRLVQSEAHYRQACMSRELLRVVPMTTVSDATYSMNSFVGLDNRNLTAPFMPVRRGQDMVFGLTVWRCWEESVCGHVSHALLHAPIESRRFSPGELFRSAGGSDTAKLLISCIQSCDFGPGYRDGPSRARELGRHLLQVGGMPLEDFEEFVRLQTCRTNNTFIALMEEHLQAYQQSPAFWATDLRRYIDTLRQASMRTEYWIPLDLVDGRSSDDTRRTAQCIVRKFGQLLIWWPDIVEVARELRAEGQRLATPI